MQINSVTWDNYDGVYAICAGYDQISGGVQTYNDALKHLALVASHYGSAGLSACIEMCIIAYFKPKILLMTGQTRSGKVVERSKGVRAIVDPAFWTYLPRHTDDELDQILAKEAKSPEEDQKIFRNRLREAHPDSDVWKINWTKVKNITLLFWELGTAGTKKILIQIKEKKKPSLMNIYDVKHEANSSKFAIGAKNLDKFISNLPAIQSSLHPKLLFLLDLSNPGLIDQRITELKEERSSQ
jgi:hypothetical protein